MLPSRWNMPELVVVFSSMTWLTSKIFLHVLSRTIGLLLRCTVEANADVFERLAATEDGAFDANSPVSLRESCGCRNDHGENKKFHA